MIQLTELIKNIDDLEIFGSNQIAVNNVSNNSKKIKSGDIYVKASSYIFNRDSKTMESITISDVNCKMKSPIGSEACAEINALSSGSPIVFRANSTAELGENSFAVLGNLEFADLLMKVKLEFNVDVLDDGSELMQGLLVIPSANLKSSNSDVKIYIKGKK